MMTENYIHDIIGSIVDGIKPTGTITNVVQNAAGNYVISTVNSLLLNEIISISNDNSDEYNDILVLEQTSTTLTISTDIEYDSQYAYTWKAEAPYYLHEKRKRANEILTVKDTGSTSKWKKYPLVLLLRPFTEDLTNQENVTADLSIAIVNGTKRDYNAGQRYEYNITPILEPIYDELIQGMIDSSEITIFGIDKMQHRREDECLIDGNPLPDTLDGILIEFINLPFKRKC